jgi:pyridine nucleotide-disulfide oxidoreductase family protein
MKKLVLLGGGHAHVNVLKSFAQNKINADVTLITPHLRQVYSGMLPGWVAGHYQLDDLTIALAPLAKAAGATLIETFCDALDLARQEIICRNGERVAFDYLSIDTGSVAHTANIVGADKMLSIRPIEDFINAMNTLKTSIYRRHQDGKPTKISVVGAGAGGVEIALALQHAYQHFSTTVSLISAANTLPSATSKHVVAALKRANINVYAGLAAAEVADTRITLADGKTVEADFVIAALGAKAPVWPSDAGLTCDKQGYILTNQYLQSISHASVFAAGDVATTAKAPRPKSGVYAVRAGPPLTANLRRAVNGETLTPYAPQTRSLYLISTGEKHAIGAWGNLSWQGQWVWRWKDQIDRAFIAKYRLN